MLDSSPRHRTTPSTPEITVDSVRGQHLQLLDGINDAIAELPKDILTQSSLVEDIKSNLTNATQPKIGTIALYLEQMILMLQ